MIIDTDKLILCRKAIQYPVIIPLPPKPIKGWVSRIKKFFTYRREFQLDRDFIIWSEFLQEYLYHPAGFIFDGASVPKILGALFASTGILFLGSVPHDLGYGLNGLYIVDPLIGEVKFKKFSKFLLDNMFKEFCILESELPIASKAAKGTLTLVGWVAWQKCRKANKLPELEILS